MLCSCQVQASMRPAITCYSTLHRTFPRVKQAHPGKARPTFRPGPFPSFFHQSASLLPSINTQSAIAAPALQSQPGYSRPPAPTAVDGLGGATTGARAASGSAGAGEPPGERGAILTALANIGAKLVSTAPVSTTEDARQSGKRCGMQHQGRGHLDECLCYLRRPQQTCAMAR